MQSVDGEEKSVEGLERLCLFLQEFLWDIYVYLELTFSKAISPWQPEISICLLWLLSKRELCLLVIPAFAVNLSSCTKALLSSLVSVDHFIFTKEKCGTPCIWSISLCTVFLVPLVYQFQGLYCSFKRSQWLIRLMQVMESRLLPCSAAGSSRAQNPLLAQSSAQESCCYIDCYSTGIYHSLLIAVCQLTLNESYKAVPGCGLILWASSRSLWTNIVV